MIPAVAPGFHVDVAAGALDHQDVLDLRAFFLGDGDGCIRIGLERNRLAATNAFVGRYDEVRLAVNNASGKRVGRKAAKHDGVNRADTCTRQHGIGRLRHHRHVERHPVALLGAQFLHGVGELAHFFVQLLVGDVLVVFGVVAFPDDRRLVAARLKMPVNAVGADIQRAVFVPLDRNIFIGIGRVLDLGERLDPVHPLAVLAPKGIRVRDGRLVHLFIFGFVGMGAFGPLV